MGILLTPEQLGKMTQEEVYLYMERHRPPEGIGDTLAAIFNAVGITRVAEIYTLITGRDCGCIKRKDHLNKLIPFKQNTK